MLKSSSSVLLDELISHDYSLRFTCTGLCYNEKDHLFYVGNIGASTPADFGNGRSTIMVLSEGLDTCLYELAIADTFPAMKDIQGVTYDPVDHTLWFCSFSENKVRHISLKGNPLLQFAIQQPTGIAYDSKRDALWILTYSELLLISKEGEVRVRYPIEIDGQDQLFYDSIKDRILMTAGLDYQGTGLVFEIHPENGYRKVLYRLIDSHAIEGIVLKNNQLFIANDGYYHQAKIPFNQINVYELGNQ